MNYVASRGPGQKVVDEVVAAGGRAILVRANVAAAVAFLCSTAARLVTGVYVPCVVART